MAARAACTASAVEPPASRLTISEASVSPVNSTVPDSGAITVPAPCSTWSTAGILSPTKSATVSRPRAISAGFSERRSNGSPSSTTPSRVSSAPANAGSQALRPAAPDSPSPVSTSMPDSVAGNCDMNRAAWV